MNGNRSLKNSFGNLLRSATLAAATVTAASGLSVAAAQEAAPPSPAPATLDADRCLPMLGAAELDAIIAESTAKLPPLTARLEQLDQVGIPLGQELRTVVQALENATDAEKPALETRKAELQAQITPLNEQRREIMAERNPLLQRQLLAEFQKGVTSFSGWSAITARAANVNVTFDGVCAGTGDGPVSVTHEGDLTTLDVTTSTIRTTPMVMPNGVVMGTAVIAVPLPLDQLLTTMPNLVSQGVYYAGLNGPTPPDNEVADIRYDPHTQSLISIVSSTIAGADQILLAVERAVNGTDMQAVEIAYSEFPQFADQISALYLTASEKIASGVIPADVRATFQNDLLMFALQDRTIRESMMQSGLQQAARAMSSAFRQVGPNQMALADPRPIFFVAEHLYSVQPTRDEIAQKLERYGIDAGAVIDTYNQWTTRADDPGKQAIEAIATIRAQAQQAANQIRQHMQQQEPEAPAPDAPQPPAQNGGALPAPETFRFAPG